MTIRVIDHPFDPGAELQTFTDAQSGAGAIVTFSGVVRGDNGLQAMEIEHYPGMTEKALATHLESAVTRFALTGALIIHRHGHLTPGDVIMMVATAAPHRKAAFEAADFLMDYLKSRAPLWKKEIGTNAEAWVAAKDEDEASLERW